MFKRKKVVFVLLASWTLLIVVFNNLVYKMPRSYHMRWLLPNQISKIARKYSDIMSSSKFLNKNEMEWLIQHNNYNRANLANLKETDEIIYIDFYKTVGKPSSPDELYTIFESFLYIKEQSLNYNIYAITCLHFGGVWMVTITRNDFEKLYDSVDTTNKSKSDLAKELAQLWAYKNIYNRRGLALKEDEKYKERIVTYWFDFINSPDDKFKLSCLWEKNKLAVWEIIEYNYPVKPGYKVEPGFSSIKDLPISETGFMYACWDEKNNIWVYGETTGLTLLKYDGEKSWESTEITDEIIPSPLEKVIEICGNS